MPQRRRRLPAVWRAGRGREKRGAGGGGIQGRETGRGGGRVVAVAGLGCPSEREDPSGGRDRRVGGRRAAQGARGRPRARTLERVCSYRKKDRVKNSLPRAAFNINEDLLSYRKKQIMFLITKRLKY